MHDFNSNVIPDKLPVHLYPGLQRYMLHRIAPGRFLRACLRNDLRNAVQCADRETVGQLQQIVDFLWQEMPANCWGSPEAYDNWLERKEPG